MSAVLPITEDERFAIYTASANQKIFSVPFPFQDGADISIYSYEATGWTLISPTGYVIAGAGEPSGGTITLSTGRTVGDQILVNGEAALARVSSVVRAGRFSSAAIDEDLDRNTIVAQEQAREIRRSLRMEAGAGPGLLISAALEPGDLLMLGEDGRIGKGPDALDIPAAQAYAASAAASAAAAEEFRDQSAANAALAGNNTIVVERTGDGVTKTFDLGVDPGSADNVLVLVEGLPQLKYSIAGLSGTMITLTEAPPEGGLVKNVNFRLGNRIDVNTPGNGTVGAAQMKATDAAAIRAAIGAASVGDALANAISGLGIANSASDAVNDIVISPGSIPSSDGSVRLVLASALTKQLDAAFAVGNNAGGRFDASISDGTWNVFLVGNGTTYDVGYSKSLDPTSATYFPAGSKYQRIGHFTRATSIRAFTQYGNGRERTYKLRSPTAFASVVTSMPTTAVLRNLQSGGIDIVPTGVKVMAEISALVTVTGTAGENFRIFSPDDADAAVDATNETHDIASGAVGRSRHTLFIATNTSGQVYTRCSVGGAGTYFTGSVIGWKDFL